MNYDQAMKGAEKAGTERRNKHRPIYRRVAWIVGSIAIIAALIWLPVGPLQMYAKEKTVPSTAPQEQQRQRADCTSTRPCSSAVLADGSTERVAIQPGKLVCFDPSFYSNLDRLSYMTSYRGRPEVKYGCTKEQVLARTCSGTVFDSFRFIPEAGVDVPQYWFVPEGTTQC